MTIYREADGFVNLHPEFFHLEMCGARRNLPTAGKSERINQMEKDSCVNSQKQTTSGTVHKRKVGVIGGSFDPVHFGHLHLAISLQEHWELDQVLFCPAALSPFKASAPPRCRPADRLAMLELALYGIPRLGILDTEIHQSGPSYTVDTMRHYKQAHDVELFLLIGEDLLSELHQWKNVEELLELATPLTGSRESKMPLMLPKLSPALLQRIQRGLTKIPIIEISSTDIRARLAKKQYCGHLVPSSVLSYMQQKDLYSSP